MIIGAGTIGLCVISALRALGSNARLLVLARHSFQAEAAKRLGANEVILGNGQYVFQEIARYLGAKILKPMMGEPVIVGGADRTFECIGTQTSTSNALSITRPGGRVIIIGMPGTLRLDWTPITVKELKVCASWAYHRAEELNGRKQTTFDLSLDLMNQGKVNLDWMVSHTFKLNEYAKAFKMLSKRSYYHLIKAAFTFD